MGTKAQLINLQPKLFVTLHRKLHVSPPKHYDGSPDFFFLNIDDILFLQLGGKEFPGWTIDLLIDWLRSQFL